MILLKDGTWAHAAPQALLSIIAKIGDARLDEEWLLRTPLFLIYSLMLLMKLARFGCGYLWGLVQGVFWHGEDGAGGRRPRISEARAASRCDSRELSGSFLRYYANLGFRSKSQAMFDELSGLPSM